MLPTGQGGGASHQRGISLARQGGCMVFAAKGGIKMAPKAPYLPSGAVLHTSRGREPGARPGGVSRSWTEPLAPRARGPAASSTLAAKPRQPSGILESTAQVPISTAPQAPEPSFRNSARHLTASGQRLLSHFPNFSSKASFSASSLVFPSFMKRWISFSMAS